MRLFAAVCLTDGAKDALVCAQAYLLEQGLSGRPSPRGNLHVTLAFIGEWPDPAAASAALSRVRFSPFKLEPEGIGAFGDTVWAGVKASSPLCALARDVRRALARAGIPYDAKPFAPHITLLRGAKGSIPRVGPIGAPMAVDRFYLMKSDLSRGGAAYTPVACFRAKGI